MNRWGSIRRWMLVLAVSLTSGVAWAQAASVEYDQTAAVLERIGRIMETLDAARGAIDRTAFDADALAFEFAFDDADTIASWVREEIAFQPYAGVLRGPDGTLRTRAGNAFDQALLLARLMNDAGYETRIAVATLADADAARLASLSSAESPAVPPIGDIEAIRAALGTFVELVGDDEERTLAALDEVLEASAFGDATSLDEVATIATEILRTLDEAEAPLGEGAMTALVRASTSYAWTEYRLGPDDPWSAAHPTGFEPPAELEVVETFSDDVPAAYLHRIRIEAWIEAKAGGELTIQPVMAPWDRPVANADHVVVDYSNAPDPADFGDTFATFDLEAVVDDAQAFLPNLFGSLAEGALIFDLDGRVLSPDVAGSAASGVFRSLAQNAEGALGELGAIGTDDEADDVLALTGHGIDVTLIAPDGTETTHRRWIVDRLGAEARAAGDTTLSTDPEERARVARALVGRHRIMVSTGGVTPAFLLDRAIERVLETRPLLEFVASNLGAAPNDVLIDADVVPGPTGLDALGALDAFDRTLADVDAGVGYRPGPAVLILSETVTDDGDGFRHSVDIVTNPRRVLREGADGIVIDATAAVRRGAWETVVEREMLDTPDDAMSSGDVVDAVAAADLRGPYRLFRPGDAVVAAEIGVDATVAERMGDDLARGSYVLLGTLPDGDQPAWWRVDPVSGTTLGITADGRGQATTEYLIQLTDSIATIAFSVKGLASCYEETSGPAQACCLLKAHLSNVAGLGLGSLVGGAFSSGAGLIFGVTTGAAGVDWSDYMGLSCEAFGAF